MSIGRLQAALAQATNEVTVAAANINFDFTLVKYEAPKEYQDLGNALSNRRRNEAEVGQPHITARRLGALFDGICPTTPNLIKAYGLRASEIAAAAKQSFPVPSNSIFAEQSGIDGTSIWAAATTSSSAIHVQLLACMLARLFDVQQATSIWYELVRERRNEISTRYENGEQLPFASLSAATQAEISRDNLAEWDASARAWLRTADKVKKSAQQQLMLIVANANVAIAEDMMVYSSVMSAWQSALSSMESLVKGSPQAVNVGPPLLALSAWHLYPDLSIIGDKEKHIRFQDSLISPGGILTIGLGSVRDEERGIHWSLSLAFLNFYGPPVVTKGRYDATSKLSFQDFTVAVFGAVLGIWRVNRRSVEEVARLMTMINDQLTEFTLNEDVLQSDRSRIAQFLGNSSHWWRLLTNAASTLLTASETDKARYEKLVNLSIRRCDQFIPTDDKDWSPVLGLCESSTMVRLIKGKQNKLKFLQTILKEYRSHLDEGLLVIRDAGTGRRDAEYETVSGTPRRRWVATSKAFGKDEMCTPIYHQEVVAGSFGDIRFRCWEGDTVRIHEFHEFRMIYGDEHSLSICQDSWKAGQQQQIPSLAIGPVLLCLQHRIFDPVALLNYLTGCFRGADSLSAAMIAYEAAAVVYKTIPSAEVSVEALEQPISTTAWAQSFLKARHSTPHTLDRETAFACVAFMEACVDLAPGNFKSVSALAHEDSIYVAMPVSFTKPYLFARPWRANCSHIKLVCDPWDQPNAHELRHFLGNVGRPGVTLIVPPTARMKRSSNPSSWKLISTTGFNGLPEDYFGSTSLHLSFTEYHVPVHLAGKQARDSRVFYLESYVSVHDRGEWVGDIDILKALSNPRLTRNVDACEHVQQDPPVQTQRRETDPVFQVPVSALTSAETWQDVLDPPIGSSVVRTYGNWLARLAAAAMLSQDLSEHDERKVIICSPHYCWQCEMKTHIWSQVGIKMNDYGSDQRIYVY